MPVSGLWKCAPWRRGAAAEALTRIGSPFSPLRSDDALNEIRILASVKHNNIVG